MERKSSPATIPPGGKVGPARSTALADRAKSAAPSNADFDLIRSRLNAKPRHLTIRPSVGDRIADALGSQRWFDRFVGFYFGTMFCCATMIAWVML